MYQNVTERKFTFFDKRLSNLSEFYYLELGFYTSITDIVETTNTLIQEKHNNKENCIAVKMSLKTQKVEIYLADEGLHPPVRVRDTFSEVLLVMNLE